MERISRFSFSPSHYTLPFSPHFKGLRVFKWWHICFYTHTCSPLHTCKPRPLGLLWLAAVRGPVISCLVITELSSHENSLSESSHAMLLFTLNQECLSPFSDCHQVLRRLWAKVVTTFSIVWLSWLLSSSYIRLESHTKHFFSSWWTESVKGLVHLFYRIKTLVPCFYFISPTTQIQ